MYKWGAGDAQSNRPKQRRHAQYSCPLPLLPHSQDAPRMLTWEQEGAYSEYVGAQQDESKNKESVLYSQLGKAAAEEMGNMDSGSHGFYSS